MNFLAHQVIANGGRLPEGPHHRHCYLYDGHHCSCGGKYTGSEPGPDVTLSDVIRSILDKADAS